MSEQDQGASASRPGSREPDPQAVPALPGFDPSRIMFARMPSDEELHEICSAKYERVKSFMIDQWPASVAALSMPTKMVPVDAGEIRELWESDPVLWGPPALALAEKLDAEMGWTPFFVRLNSRSPKDVEAMPITCSGKQAVMWIMNSERCLDDCTMAYHAKAPVFVCLREPRYMHPDEEFRCFAKDGKVLGLTRYFYDREPVLTLRDPDVLLAAATAFYERHLAEHYPTVVFDLYAPGTDEELLIELNPYGMSDPCLFGSYEQVERGGVRLRDSDGSRMAETNEDSARGEAEPARAEGIAQGPSLNQDSSNVG